MPTFQLKLSGLFLIALLLTPSLTRAFSSQYVVGEGDQLFVDFPLRGSLSDLQSLAGNGLTLVIVGESVYFRYHATVAPDGFITLPSMDPLRITGMTVEQVRDEISSHLKPLTRREPISVILDKPISRAFTVSGQVNTPGRFVYSRPTSLMEALAIAGGPTNHAQMKNVMLFRAGESTRRFNLSDKELQKTGPPDVTLYPSDTVIVPRRWYTPEGSMILIFLSILTTGAAIYVATKAD